MKVDDQRLLGNCLDGLQEAAEALEEFEYQDSDISRWYEEIQQLYGKIDARYSR